jgi:hypothetical protein
MISDLERATPNWEVFVPEFGLFDSQAIDAGKNHQARIYRLSPETLKTLSDLIGFTAKFDSPSVRTVYADIFKTKGRALLEIDRNTKPTDVSVRYMRDRWNVHEVASKGAEVLRPWVCTLYNANFLPEKVFAGIAAEARISMLNIEHFFIRLNFKDRTIGLIGEESRAQEFPGGAFAVVAVPKPTISSITMAEAEDELADGSALEDQVVMQEGVIMETEEQAVAEAEVLGSGQESADSYNQVGDQAGDSPATTETATVESEPAQVVDAYEAKPVSDATPAETVQATPIEQATPVEQATASGAQPEGFFREQAKPEPKPEPKVIRQEAPVYQQAQAQQAQAQQAQAQQRSFANASRPTVDSQIKYAVYSKSEVDQMLKQQGDAVTNGLASKINSQQRLLQDLIANQERTFSKLQDKFVTEVDNARQKIDNSAKHASDVTKQDLQDFRTQLSKELEQYRAQINKNIIPLGKTIDEKIKAMKEVSADRGKDDIRSLVIKIAAVLAILIIASDVLVVVNMVKMSELVNLKGQVSSLSDKIDKMSAPAASPTATPAQDAPATK